MRTTARRSLKRVAAGVCAGVLTGFAALSAAPAQAQAGFTFTRLAGTDRYETAAKIATTSFVAADTVLLASGENFPDALAGNYLAGNKASPILLTATATLPKATQDALATLKAKNVLILGGTSAVSTSVESTLTASYAVTRIAGKDRYETAKKIAETPASSNVGTVGGVKTAILASGQSFADALTAGPVGFAKQFPVEITDPTALSADTKQAFTDLGIKNVLIAGGSAAVSTAVEDQVKASGITTSRLQGATRQLTAEAIADYAVANAGFKVGHANLARGDGFADALAGGPHGGVDLAPILLTDNPTTLGAAATDYLTRHSSTLTDGHIFGGTSAVADSVKTAAETAGRSVISNQTLSVTPTTNVTQAQGSTRQFSVAGLDNAKSYTIQLFSCSNTSTDNGKQTSFTQTSPPSGTAPGSGKAAPGTLGTNTITVVNGAASTTATATATPNTGTITFTVKNGDGGSSAPTCVAPVVFQDANADSALNVDPFSGRPTEGFGEGGTTTFTPTAAATAATVGPITVLTVDKAANTFVGQTGSGSVTYANYSYDGNDTYSTLSSTPPGPVSGMAAFEQALSPDDSVSAMPYNADPTMVSSFSLTDSAPVAPPTVTAAPTSGSSSITVTITDSTTVTVSSYNVYRATPASTGTSPPTLSCPTYPTPSPGLVIPPATAGSAYALLGAVSDADPGVGSGSSVTFVDTTVTAANSYCYAVTSVDSGDESTAGTVSKPATASAGSGAGAPFIQVAKLTTDAAPVGSTGPADVWTLVFNEPLAFGTGGAVAGTITVTKASSELLTCGSTSSTCAANTSADTTTTPGTTYAAGRVVTITVGTPTSGSGGLAYPIMITGLSGFADADENLPASLASSTDTTIG